ncbi:MAG: tetratricopeptide repeat protein, partial [Candidatus Polarisedimenticolia bacterium]
MSRRLLALVVVSSLLAVTGCDSLKARVLLVKGHKAYKAQQYEEAIGYYKQILQIKPEDPQVNYMVA